MNIRTSELISKLRKVLKKLFEKVPLGASMFIAKMKDVRLSFSAAVRSAILLHSAPIGTGTTHRILFYKHSSSYGALPLRNFPNTC